MISSAGSLRKSRRRRVRTTASVRGQTWTLARNRSSSGSPRSSSIRPSWESLASSHRTIAEMPHRAVRRIRSSLAVTSPVMAWIRRWVSRLSMPFETSREDVPFNFDASLQPSDELGGFCPDRNQLGDGLPAFCDHDAVFVHPIEYREALLLEFRGRDLFHGQMIALV